MADTEVQISEKAGDPPVLAYCDGCNKVITDINHKCLQCPDYDYCSSCVITSAQLHPHHEFSAKKGRETLSDEVQREWQSKRSTNSESDATFRLTGQVSDRASDYCLCCAPVTKPLPVLSFILKDPATREVVRKRGFGLRWPLRISSLVQATQKGCAFCSFMLQKFFGIGNAQAIMFEPERPWYMEIGQQEQRDALVRHAMDLIASLKTDKFTFTVTPENRRNSSEIWDFDRLSINFEQADLDQETLSRVFPSSGLIYVKFDVFAASGNPAAAFIRSRPTNATPASNEGFTTIREWLLNCRANHAECQSSLHLEVKDLPKHLIDVSTGDDSLKLYKPDQGSFENYAALSYCWGGPQKFCLSKNTYDDKLNSFSLSDLPLTLRDAVRVTRAVGLSYLWIDALCIVQDDEEDKLSQLRIMGSIYRHATLTIGAARAQGVCDGYLQDTSDPETGLRKDLIPLGYPLPNSNASDVETAFSMPSESFGTIWLAEEEPAEGGLLTHPTSKRGWCLQEEFLSPRFLQYKRWPTWRCNTVTLSDGGRYCENDKVAGEQRQFSRDLLKSSSNLSDPSMDLFRIQQLLQTWRILVTNFSKRKLSVETDKLPAIAGIAAEIQRRSNLQYCAGLWRNDLLADMMWYADTREWLSRYDMRLAPTWSWIAVNCPVTYDKITEDASPLARVLDCQVLQDNHSLCTTGQIILEGQVREVRREDVLDLFRDQNFAPPPPRSNDVLEWYTQMFEHIAMQPEHKIEPEEVERTLPERVYAILTFSRDWKTENEKKVNKICHSGLLLKQREDDDGYERIGSFMNESRDWLVPKDTVWKLERVKIH